MVKTHKRIAIYVLSALVGLFLAFSFVVSYAYFAKKDIYDGYISGQVELLFDRLDTDGMNAYGAAEGITADPTAVWGTKENPYVISNVRHLYNLSELQRLGYFERNHLSENTQTDLSHVPYFLISTPKYEPVAIDGTGYRAISTIGTEQHPFIGTVKGVKGTPCSIGGYSSEVSVLYNVEVKGNPQDPDVGLFGNVGFLGSPPDASAADQTFTGTPSILSTMVLYDVTVKVESDPLKVVEEFIEDIALSLAAGTSYDKAEGHHYIFTDLYKADDLTAYNAIPHENHHIGILAGHVSYSIVEFISVFYSSGDIAAIDISDTQAAKDGTAPNYLSSAGILGFIYNLNPEYNEQAGSLLGGSGSDNADLYYGIVGGGGLESGDKAGYVLASSIYNAYGYTESGAAMGDTFLLKNAYTAGGAATGTALCEEWIANGRGTGQFYFYDGVFTFALSSQEDTIEDTFGDTTPTISLGSTSSDGWHAMAGGGRVLIAAYLRQLTSDAELQVAVDEGKRLVIMHEESTSPVMLSLFKESANSGSGKLNERFTTNGIFRNYSDTETMDLLRAEYDAAADRYDAGQDYTQYLDTFETGTTFADVAAMMGALGAQGSTYRVLTLDKAGSDGSVEKLREQYKIFASTTDSAGKEYAPAYYAGDVPVSVEENVGMSEYYDYANQTDYAGYIYYTEADYYIGKRFEYFWQPKEGEAISLGSSTGWGNASPDLTAQQNKWQGETVYQRTYNGQTYVGVVVNSGTGKFYNSGNTAYANGASLRKPATSEPIGYFFRNAGTGSYYYMTDPQTPITATITATGGRTPISNLPLYTDGTHTGILLDRYSRYAFHTFGETDSEHYMRIIKAEFTGVGAGTQHTLWNGPDASANNTGTFESAGLGDDWLVSKPSSVENRVDATVRFVYDSQGNYSHCYIEYTIGTVAQYMCYNGNEAFKTSPSTSADTKLNIYVLENTQTISSGTVKFAPDNGITLPGDEYLLWPQSVVEVGNGYQKSSVDANINAQFSLVSLADLAWSNGDALNAGGILSGADLRKKFHMVEGINFGGTLSLSALGNSIGGFLGGLLGNIEDIATSGIVQAPVGTAGIKAKIPAGCVAFRVNKMTTEGQKIRVIVALPTSICYPGEDGYDLGDYNRYFCVWEMPEASSQVVQTFDAEDYIERFLLPRSHPYDPALSTSPPAHGTANAGNITVSYDGTTYGSYLNGERLLVAYEFTIYEEGLYVLGTSADSNGGAFSDKNEAPMEIVYFSVGGVASTGRDGSSGSQIGTIDFVYANNGNIVTVTESSSTDSEGREDYSTYYPSYVLLYMIADYESGGTGFYDINNECVYIERYITDESPPTSSDGYQTTPSYSVIGYRLLRDKHTRLAQYSRYADNVKNRE